MRSPLLAGARFGRLVVIAQTNKPEYIKGNRMRRFWLCLCDCGKEHTVSTSLLTSGLTRSCGCLGLENRMSGSRFYQRWRNIRSRCENKNNPAYPWYGGRGIKVCERWHVFENFLADMGCPPTPKHQVDRINNDGNYEPGNCRWVTIKENAANTIRTVLIDFDGEKYPLRDACKKIGTHYPVVSRKAKKTGISHQEAFDYFRKKKTASTT
jgi:hypothetical protein